MSGGDEPRQRSSRAASPKLQPSLPQPKLPWQRSRPLLSDEEIVPWSLMDRLGLAAAWAAGLLLCAIAGSIVIYMLVRGLQYVKLDAYRESPIVGSTTETAPRARAAATTTRSSAL